MKKTAVFLTMLGMIYASSLLAQTSCASFQVVPQFDTSDTVYVDLHERLRFETSNGRPANYTNLVLPPGYSMQGDHSSSTDIVGEMQTAGTYEFSFVATATETGCQDTVKFFRTYVDSPTHICEKMTIRSDWNSGSEFYVGRPIDMTFFVSDGGEDPPFTFSSYDLRSSASLDSMGHYTDSTSSLESWSFHVVARDRFGCTDTLKYEIFTQCIAGIGPQDQTLSNGTSGQPYSQQIDGQSFLLYPPYTDFVVFEPLPPGLTLGSNGVLSGTPTAPGNYNFTARYKGLGGCEAGAYISIRIDSAANACGPITIHSDWTSGAEHWVGEPIHMTFFVSNGGTSPFTFSSPDLRSTASLSSSGYYTDTTKQVENYAVTIVVKDSLGCTDSLRYEIFTMCVVPAPMFDQTLASGTTGQPYSQQVSGVQFQSYPPFSNFEGFETLPPGLTLSRSGTLSGTPTTPGNYLFNLRYTGLGGCPSQGFVSVKINQDSTTQACKPITIRSDWNSGSEFWVGSSISMKFYVTEGGENPPFTFYGLDLRSTAQLDSSGRYTDTTRQVEQFDFRIVVKDRLGCTDTLTYDIFTMCVTPEPMGAETLPAGTRGQPYSQQIPGAQLGAFGPFNGFFTFQTLPPGLSLSDGGVLSGTPTASGNYSVQFYYFGVGGCRSTKTVALKINEAVHVQSLWITPVCAQADTIRNWVVHNPNSFSINIEWQRVYAPLNYGTFTAQPGDNNFSIRNDGWPNTVRISWYDQNGVKKSIVQASNDNLCTPPECVKVDGVTFYHQGRQRDGNIIPLWLSNARNVEGAPNANDGLYDDRAFSLGYNGFITMKLTGDVYDQPGPDLKVWEYSLNDPDYRTYPERAEVFVSTDNATWISLGLTNPLVDCHSKLDWEFDLAGKATWCRYVKVVDVTDRWAWVLNSSCSPTNVRAFNDASNGFDLDAITCPNYSNDNDARVASDQTAEQILNKDSDDQFAVAYPNPATSWLTLDFARDPNFIYPEDGQVEINVIDMTGKIGIKGIHYLDNEWKTKVNVESLSSGLFVAKVRANGVTKHYKFVRN